MLSQSIDGGDLAPVLACPMVQLRQRIARVDKKWRQMTILFVFSCQPGPRRSTHDASRDPNGTCLPNFHHGSVVVPAEAKKHVRHPSKQPLVSAP